MDIPIWLIGTLANHRRSRILQDVLSAKTTEKDLPESGIYLLFGKDFQEAEEARQKAWYDSAQKPNRMLLLVPPFKTVECSIPCQWSIIRTSGSNLQQDLLLPKLLAPEVLYELHGQLQIASQIGGQWNNLSINTAYYRQHPHSGIFAMTCLPLWSLAILDCQSQLHYWLEEFYSLVGQSPETEIVEQKYFAPKAEHFTVLLHLLTQNFTDQTVALVALENSSIFSIDLQVAQSCLTELEFQGFVVEANITTKGKDLIRQSPYSVYADALVK